MRLQKCLINREIIVRGMEPEDLKGYRCLAGQMTLRQQDSHRQWDVLNARLRNHLHLLVQWPLPHFHKLSDVSLHVLRLEQRSLCLDHRSLPPPTRTATSERSLLRWGLRVTWHRCPSHGFSRYCMLARSLPYLVLPLIKLIIINSQIFHINSNQNPDSFISSLELAWSICSGCGPGG